MAALIISNSTPYNWGVATNRIVANAISIQTQILRLADAISTASSGYEGVPGTQFEIGNPTTEVMPTIQRSPSPMPFGSMGTNQNLFGVYASTTPGEQGEAYRYAIENLTTAWKTFWDTAQPFIEALDNGQMTV